MDNHKAQPSRTERARLTRKAQKRDIKFRWYLKRRVDLEKAVAHLTELVGERETYPTHAAYMAAVNAAVADKRKNEVAA